MTELNEMHFETIDSNKDKMYQRKKLEYLEDRITTLEKSKQLTSETIKSDSKSKDKKEAPKPVEKKESEKRGMPIIQCTPVSSLFI